MSKKEIKTIDPTEKVRKAIVKLVGARLDAMEALQQLKADKKIKPIEYDAPVEELEEFISKCYDFENYLGDIHQSILISIATETLATCGEI